MSCTLPAWLSEIINPSQQKAPPNCLNRKNLDDAYTACAEFHAVTNICQAPNQSNQDTVLKVPKESRSNLNDMLRLVQKDWRYIWFISKSLENNRLLLATAANQNTEALWEASKELTSDFDFMRNRVTRDREALYYASDELRNNPTLVAIAAYQNVDALYHASPELRDNIEFMTKRFQDNKEAFQYASDRVKSILKPLSKNNIKAIKNKPIGRVSGKVSNCNHGGQIR
jgi:hypothetical protein